MSELELAPAASITTLRARRPRVGTVNCVSAAAIDNAQHLPVRQLSDGQLLAICGHTFSKTSHDTDTETCGCAPAEQWPRCDGCVQAKADSDARSAARVR